MLRNAVLLSSLLVSVLALSLRAYPNVVLQPIGTYSTGVFDESAAEIVAHDPVTQRLFVTNTFVTGSMGMGGVDVLDISDPTNPTLLFTIDTTTFGDEPTSVSVSGSTVAVAVRNDPEDELEGKVAFFDTDGAFLNAVQVGFGPDMLIFTPDGTTVLVANQGEPSDDYTIDPEGSISLIDVSGGVPSATVATASFSKFNGQEGTLRDNGVRIFGPVVVEVAADEFEIVGEASAANDLEPESIAVSFDSSTAWVTLQENNALATLDIASAEIVDITGLGYKNHRAYGNGLDGSDRDGGILIARSRVKGMYQPDGIVAYSVDGEIFLVTANEGDARDFDTFSEEERLKDVNVIGGLKSLQDDDKLGRLNITTEPPHGKTVDKDGNVTLSQLYSYGTRSFSIWNENVQLVFDSGDHLEQLTAAALPDHFNANDANDFDDGAPDNLDSRSDNKGPEPESVVVGEIDGSVYAFIGLERIGGVVIYDVTDPSTPLFESYVNRRDFTKPNTIVVGGMDITNPDVGDLAVEGLAFIAASDSPNGKPLLVTANEVSGTTTVFEIASSP